MSNHVEIRNYLDILKVEKVYNTDMYTVEFKCDIPASCVKLINGKLEIMSTRFEYVHDFRCRASGGKGVSVTVSASIDKHLAKELLMLDD